MAADKFLTLNGGTTTEKAGATSSAGAGDAGRLVALGAAGKIDASMLPTSSSVTTVVVSAGAADVGKVPELDATGKIDASMIPGSSGVTTVTSSAGAADSGKVPALNGAGKLDASFVAQTALTVTDSSSIDLTASGTDSHSLTAAVKLSATAGNVLTTNADGLYVPTPATETTLTVTDSSSVDLTAGGTNGHAISAAVKVSATAGNTLTTNADGLYVPTPATETTLTVTDSSTVDLTAGGTNGHALTAAVKVSATAGNQITANADGLYVAAASAGAQTPITVTDTATVDLLASGTDSHTLQADVKLSATAGNTLTANADGLYVPTPASETTLTVTDTATVDLTAGGTNGHAISAAVKLSATAGNVVTANADGLYVPTPTAETALTVTDSSTVDLTASGTSGHALTADVKLSATAGNAISANADGLYAAAARHAAAVGTLPATALAAAALTTLLAGSPATVTYQLKTSGSTGLGFSIPVATPILPATTASFSVDADDILIFSVETPFGMEYAIWESPRFSISATGLSLGAFTEQAHVGHYDDGTLLSMYTRVYTARVTANSTGTITLTATDDWSVPDMKNRQITWHVSVAKNVDPAATNDGVTAVKTDALNAATGGSGPQTFAATMPQTSDTYVVVGSRHTQCSPAITLTGAGTTVLNIENPDNYPAGYCSLSIINCNIAQAVATLASGATLTYEVTENDAATQAVPSRESVVGLNFQPTTSGSGAAQVIQSVTTTLTAPATSGPHDVQASVQNALIDATIKAGGKYLLEMVLDSTVVAQELLYNAGATDLPIMTTLPGAAGPSSSVANSAGASSTAQLRLTGVNHVAGSAIAVSAASHRLRSSHA